MADDVIPPAGEDESLVVNLNDDDEAKGAKPPPVPGPSSAARGAAAPPPQVGLEELQRQIEAERAERVRVTSTAQQIARERDQAIVYAREAEQRGVSSYEAYNENQIKATQDKMESLAGQAEQAMHDGDFKRASTINLQIGRLGGSLAVLERDQAVLAQQREQQQRQPQQPQRQAAPAQQQPVSSDPLERAIASRTEPTKQFLRKHPELVRGDGSLKRTAIDAHERALDDGYAVDTPAYFEYVERSLQAQVPTSGGGRAPTMAAPVGRSSGPTASGGYSGNGTFTMTPKMRRLAAEQGVSDNEWARNYVRLLAEGRITEVR